VKHYEVCQTTYCSTDCLKADKKKHRKHCGRQAEGRSNHPDASSKPNIKNLEAPIHKPFTLLDRGTFLHDRPRPDVFRLLIDCYRLRVSDNFNLESIQPPKNLRDGFKHFLSFAAQRPGLLPTWWDEGAAAECMAFGIEDVAGTGWYSLAGRVGKAEVSAQYGTPFMAMYLRFLGEQVYLRGPGGQECKAFCRMMARKEQEGAVMSAFGMSL
jgi:splicing suppressor protein 51